MAKSSSGKFYSLGDFRGLNAKTVPDFFNFLAGHWHFVMQANGLPVLFLFENELSPNSDK